MSPWDDEDNNILVDMRNKTEEEDWLSRTLEFIPRSPYNKYKPKGLSLELKPLKRSYKLPKSKLDPARLNLLKQDDSFDLRELSPLSIDLEPPKLPLYKEALPIETMKFVKPGKKMKRGVNKRSSSIC